MGSSWRYTSGSSPLTRGNLRVVRAGQVVDGLIPAHAGKTTSSSSAFSLTRAHPRSRGENPSLNSNSVSSHGSSPLMRGKRRKDRLRLTRLGLIPAHAGKTVESCRSRPEWRAHPRSRGENPSMPGGTYVDEGSSPLTQGKPPILLGENCRHGLIPAHARKTSGRRAPSRCRTAHPRSRGENIGLSAPPCCVTGSSPLTRGKPSDKVGSGVGDGPIPAHAGKIPPCSCNRRSARTHPRLRRENPR